MLQVVEAPRSHDNWNVKVVKLSALHTGRLYLPKDVIQFSWGLSRPQGHSVVGRMM